MEDIINNQNKKWDYRCMSNNPNLSLDYVSKNIKKDWDFKLLSNNPNLTFRFLLDYQNGEKQM